MITSIQTRGQQAARVFLSTSAENYSVQVKLAKLQQEHQAAWVAAMTFAGSDILQESESIRGMQMTPHFDRVQVDESETRDLIEVSVSINTGAGGHRYADITSEQLPEETRAGLLGILTFLKGKTREELQALS